MASCAPCAAEEQIPDTADVEMNGQTTATETTAQKRPAPEQPTMEEIMRTVLTGNSYFNTFGGHL